MFKLKRVSIISALIIIAVVLFSPTPGRAASWQMHQRDMHHTGRADYHVPQSRMNDTFFDDIIWQKTANGQMGSSSMVFYDGVGPNQGDIVLCGQAWPTQILVAVDRHTGKLFWQGTPGGLGCGDDLGRHTAGFSNDGQVLYLAMKVFGYSGKCFAFSTSAGPAIYWDNSSDADPEHLSMRRPCIAPDGRIFLFQWSGKIYGGTDSGSAISESWAPSASTGTCFSDPSLYMDGENMIVVAAGRARVIRAFDGVTGAELWYSNIAEGTDAGVTIDPANGNIYFGAGYNTGDIYVMGLEKGGQQLTNWPDKSIKLYDYQDGVNNMLYVTANGCLSHDGKTYYFQSVNSEAEGRLYAVNTCDGTLKWDYPTNAKSSHEHIGPSPIVTSNGVVIVGTDENGKYLAIKDGTPDDPNSPLLLDSLSVEANINGDTMAIACPVLAPDGKLYLPMRAIWSTSNGDGDTPSGLVSNCMTAFDLSGCDPLQNDTNNDCIINLLDFVAFMENWLDCGMQPPERCSQ